MEIKSNRISVYIPDVKNPKYGISSEQEAKFLCTRFSSMFGGATLTKAHGYYESKNLSIIEDDVFIVTSFSNDKDFACHITYIKDVLIHSLKERLDEECMLLDINGIANLI